MDLEALYKILGETTIQLRKGEVVTKTESKGLFVTEIYDMPHESEARPDIERVDLEFVVIGVDRAAAEKHRAELILILNTYPQLERLSNGPSYIEVGAEIGDQGAAFQLFALGKTLGLWEVITPSTIGATGEQAKQMAGMGFIMISGYRPTAKAA